MRAVCAPVRPRAGRSHCPHPAGDAVIRTCLRPSATAQQRRGSRSHPSPATNKYTPRRRRAWVDAFGDGPCIVPLGLPGGPFEAYESISRAHTHCFLLESLTGPGELAETSVMGFAPRTIVRGYRDRVEFSERRGGGGGEADGAAAPSYSYAEPSVVRTGDPMAELRRAAAPRTSYSRHRYAGGAVGVVDYDAVRLFERVPEEAGPAQGPLFEFGLYDDGVLYDNAERRLYYFAYAGQEEAEGAAARLRAQAESARPPRPGAFRAGPVEASMGEDEFADAVRSAKRHVHAGDAFQVVLSRRYEFEARGGDDLAVYAALRRLNPSPYMFHVRQGDRLAVGASPEMLVRVTGRDVETFPIAGTRPVTGDAAADDSLARELLADEKELAEHTMLVDLGRNDIGRVCEHGSVRVDELMQIRRFSHVQHIVSHVAGRLRAGADMFDAFAAVFPAGTVSGAPKVRAMEIIDGLEPCARGPYAGAVGYFSANGCCDFAIAIRAVFVDGPRGFVQAGAGIVSDSDPHAEFAETEHKAGAALQAVREASVQ